MPIQTATWGPFSFIALKGNKIGQVKIIFGKEWLGSIAFVLATTNVDMSNYVMLSFVSSIAIGRSILGLLLFYFLFYGYGFFILNVNVCTTPLVNESF
jgi:hypothetical protein